MKVLWLCNIMLPAFAKACGLPYSNREGWLTGSFERLVSEPLRGGSSKRLVDLGVCCPVPDNPGDCRMEVDGAVFYGFHENLRRKSTITRSRTASLRFSRISSRILCISSVRSFRTRLRWCDRSAIRSGH